MKKDIIKILSKRAEHFEKIHHSFEAREIKSAIDTIERLMPPELFSIPVVTNSLLEQKVIDIEDEISRLKEFTGLDQL